MTLSQGTQLGSFEITALIGVGGMGEVYRARDTKLGREVAIKVLPEVFAKDKERLARFEREAKLLASLDHSNIASIYELQEADGVRFLVMQLVEGQTLADRIKAGAIPIDEALQLFAQIAEALESAHEHGVIHRDLKPANIKVTEEGKVKVLDFGLAKAFDAQTASSSDSGGTLALGSEHDAVSTGEGKVLGTPAYMSPEQASGKSVDKRTDIWAFGCCLYEALTGRRPFAGSNATELVADIIKGEPDWNALPKETPARVRILLWRCLQKSPQRRLRDIGEARFEIGETSSDPSGAIPALGSTVEKPAISRTRHIVTALAALFLGGLVVGLVVGKLKPPPPAQDSSEPRPIHRSTINLEPGWSWMPEGAYLPWIALSPDGKNLAYVATKDGRRNAFLRPLDQLEARMLSGSEGSSGVIFSPDGEWLALYGAQGNWKLSIAGGRPLLLAPTQQLRSGLSWSAEGVVYFNAGLREGIARVQASGGEPEAVLEFGEGEFGHFWPEALPGGKAILFGSNVGGQSGVTNRVEVLLLETGERRILLEGANHVRYVPTGHLIYTNSPDSDTVMAVPFDLSELRLAGTAVAILPEVLVQEVSGCAQLTFSNDGTLVYIPQASSSSLLRRLVWVDREGNEEPLDQPPRAYGNPRISPDGLRVATQLTDASNLDIHVLDLARGTLSRITFDPGADSVAVWSPNGQFLYYSTRRRSGSGIYRKAADGTGSAELVGVPGMWPYDIASDGSFMLFGFIDPETSFDVGLASLTGNGEPRRLLNQRFFEANAALSPDERWIAYESDETGRFEVYVQPFPHLDGKWQISLEGGGVPIWGPDGKELIYAIGETLMRTPILETEPTFAAGAPEVLLEGPYLLSDFTGREYDISPDGERFLVLKAVEGETLSSAAANTMVVVENWFEELKRLVPSEED